MKAMWTESVRPLLMERQNCTLHSVTLRVLGGESDIEYKVRDLLENPNPIQKRIRVVKKEKYNSVYQAYISLY